MLTLGSICAGMGGFDLAFASTGKFKTKWWVEIDKNAQKVLTRHFPNSKQHDDLRQLKPTARDAVDAIAGGTPCQDLSVAGSRGGLDAERSGLFYQMLRICKRLRPRVILWENVPGVFSSNGGRDFASVIRAFTGLQIEVPTEGWPCAGYVRTPFDACRWSVAWRVFDAQFSNLAQRRERVFVVAGAGGVCPEKILFESESVCWNSPPSRQAKERVTPTVEGRAGRSGTNNFATSGGLAEVAPPIAGVSNGGGANGPGRTADDAESLVPVVASTVRSSPPSRHGGGSSPTDGHMIPVVAHTVKCKAKGAIQIEDTFIPEKTGPIRSHHCRQDLDSVAYIPEKARPLRAQAQCRHREDSETFVLAHGQGKAECVSDGEPSLTCNHEAPIVAFHGSQDPDVSGDVSHPCGRNQGQETCVAFKASHYTRDKDGAPSPVAPPLSADADKGDQDTLLLAFSCKDSGNDVGKDISPTLRAQNFKDSHMNGGGQLAVASPRMEVRRLTPMECLRLQGFSDTWLDGLELSDSAKYRLIGNSVAVPVVNWIAERIAIEIALAGAKR